MSGCLTSTSRFVCIHIGWHLLHLLSQLLKRTVDLENMVFSQGGHLMSNKKCKLPDGSFKRACKGYEEIHVPTPKQKPVVEGEIVPVSALPA